MRTEFAVDGVPVTLTYNWFFGGLSLKHPDGVVKLQRAANPSTHFSVARKRVFTQSFRGHQITIVKTRARFFPGFRPHDWEISVDDTVISRFRAM